MTKSRVTPDTKYVCLLANKADIEKIDEQAKLHRRSRNNYLLWALSEIAANPPTSSSSQHS